MYGEFMQSIEFNTQSFYNRKKLFSFTILISMILAITSITGCSNGLSGIYQSESGVYSIRFISSTECIWYQDGSFFEGTYKKINNGYQLYIKGSGLYPNTIFNAITDKKDLIITGGIVHRERFVKNKMVNMPVHAGGSLYVNKKITQSEYTKMMQKKELEEKETHKKMLEKGKYYRKQKDEWNENYNQHESRIIRSRNIEFNEIDIIAESQKQTEIKSQEQTEIKPQKKPIYEARGIKIYESK